MFKFTLYYNFIDGNKYQNVNFNFKTKIISRIGTIFRE